MITVPTTLVLGAGASKPYDFPTGKALREELCDPGKLNGLPEKYSEQDISAFCEAFKRSQMPSIDAFLANRKDHHVMGAGSPTFSELGKAAIAYCLMQREDESKLFLERDDHWYQYLWSKISDSLESFGSSQLKIITFNYDRSLERYLLVALQNAFGIRATDAATHLRKIPILHVYGKLGALPELPEPNSQTRPYSADKLTPMAIDIAAKGIRVIDEHRKDDGIFQQASSWLRESQRICFIGFGFDSTNVRRLKLHALRAISENPRELSNCMGYATTYRMENAERSSVVNLLVRGHSINNNHGEVLKNIEPYASYQPERYLRATGVLNDLSA